MSLSIHPKNRLLLGISYRVEEITSIMALWSSHCFPHFWTAVCLLRIRVSFSQPLFSSREASARLQVWHWLGDAAVTARGRPEGTKYWQVHLPCGWAQHHCRHACVMSVFHMVDGAWKIILALALFLTWQVFSFCHALLCSNSYTPMKPPSLLPQTVLQTFKWSTLHKTGSVIRLAVTSRLVLERAQIRISSCEIRFIRGDGENPLSAKSSLQSSVQVPCTVLTSVLCPHTPAAQWTVGNIPPLPLLPSCQGGMQSQDL